MRRFQILFFVILFAMNACNNSADNTKKDDKNANVDAKIIGKPELKLESDLMTPEVLWSLGRLSGGVVSVDKKTVLYGVTYFDIAENRGNRELYTMPIEGGEQTKLTITAGSEWGETWTPDGKSIAFLSAENGSVQLWTINTDGSNKQQVSNIEGGISNYLFTPKMDKILYTKDVKTRDNLADMYPDLPKANAKIYDDLMYRHWDHWVNEFSSHIFIAEYANGKITGDTDIMPNEPYDAPMMPWGGIEEINWSPDGTKVAYTCKKMVGKNYATSTNSEIYIYDLGTKKTENISEGLVGYDKCPTFSPDGKKLVWWSMEQDGYEADKQRVMIYDFEAKKHENYSENFDQNAEHFVWAADGKTIYFLSGIKATYQLFALNTETKEYKKLTEGIHNYTSFHLAGEKFIATKMSMSMPTEIFSVNISDGAETQLTFINKEVLDKLKLAKVEKRMMKTDEGDDMLTWVIYPPNFDPSKKYPTLLYCQGGPQSAISQFFSYRWNFQMMAAKGYIIVAPNRHGLPTFGQEWNAQISKDYGGQNQKDVLLAIDEMKKEPFVDDENLGAIGASYGGFAVYWLAGNHEKRFKAFIAHCGIFNFDAMYASTEEVFFTDWDMGGSYWDKEPKNSYGASPHLFVKNWDTPILVIHGEKDFRIPYTQGMQAFNSAQLRGVPSRFLYFPTENHWVLSAQNGILWQREFFGWLDKYLVMEN